MKPILKYSGGKSKEIKYFEKYIPKYTGNYIEPFFGGGSLYFYLEPEYAIINDLNPKLINFYQEIQTDFYKLLYDCKHLKNLYDNNSIEQNKQLYLLMRDMFNNKIKKEYSDGAIYYFINKLAFSGMIRYNSKNQFNVPFGYYKSFNVSFDEKYHTLMKPAKIFNKNYSYIFDMSNQNDFMFLDPPYHCIFSNYGNEKYKNGFSEDDHRMLAEDFKNLSCKALMVIGKTPLIYELYKNYIVDEYDKNYSISIKNRIKSSSVHLIIKNY